MRLLKPILSLLLLFGFTALLDAPHGGRSAFYLLSLCALAKLALRPQPIAISLTAFIRQYWPLHVAMIWTMLAIFVSDLHHAQWSFKSYEAAFQLALFPLISWVLLSLTFERLRISEWGFVLAAIVSPVLMYVATNGGAVRNDLVVGTKLIPFTNLSLLLGILALMSLRNNKKEEWIAIAIKLLAGACALYTSYLSQTRGGWLALPIFIILGVAAIKRLRIANKIILIAALFLALGTVAKYSSVVSQRILAVQNDIASYEADNDRDTSLGVRLQLWRGSWILFTEHPIFGIGLQNFPQSLDELQQRGLVTPFTAKGFTHSHNDVLFNMLTLGIGGLAAILAMFFVPAAYFIRDLRHADDRIKSNAYMGLSLIAGLFIFGLSDTIFFWGISHTFYSLGLAILFAQSVRCHLEEKKKGDAPIVQQR